MGKKRMSIQTYSDISSVDHNSGEKIAFCTNNIIIPSYYSNPQGPPRENLGVGLMEEGDKRAKIETQDQDHEDSRVKGRHVKKTE